MRPACFPHLAHVVFVILHVSHFGSLGMCVKTLSASLRPGTAGFLVFLGTFSLSAIIYPPFVAAEGVLPFCIRITLARWLHFSVVVNGVARTSSCNTSMEGSSNSYSSCLLSPFKARGRLLLMPSRLRSWNVLHSSLPHRKERSHPDDVCM